MEATVATGIGPDLRLGVQLLEALARSALFARQIAVVPVVLFRKSTSVTTRFWDERCQKLRPASQKPPDVDMLIRGRWSSWAGCSQAG
jgi:hypothetical protein